MPKVIRASGEETKDRTERISRDRSNSVTPHLSKILSARGVDVGAEEVVGLAVGVAVIVGALVMVGEAVGIDIDIAASIYSASSTLSSSLSSGADSPKKDRGSSLFSAFVSSISIDFLNNRFLQV